MKPVQQWLKGPKYRVPWRSRFSQDAAYRKKRQDRRAERKAGQAMIAALDRILGLEGQQVK